MKTIKYVSILFCLSLLFMVSCNDDHEIMKMDPSKYVNPELTLNVPTLDGTVIDASTNQKDSIGYVTWSVADFGLNSLIKYVVTLDTTENFNTEKSLIQSSDVNMNQKITLEMLNKVAVEFTGESKEVTMYMRVKAYMGEDFMQHALASKTDSFTFTCYSFIPKQALYIVGDGLVGWGNDFANMGADLQLFFADKAGIVDKIYTFTSEFKGNGSLKFPTIAGDWSKAYAVAGENLVINDSPGSDVLKIPATTGLYTLTADLNALTISITAYTGTATTYASMEIIGDGAKGWGENDGILMTQAAPHVWVAKDVALNPGQIKFRTDKTWANNWGSAIPASEQELPYSIGTKGSDNIVIIKNGSYYVAFNDITMHYVIIPMADLLKKINILI